MTKSVLLVEDEDSIALALQFLMQREGYDLRRARTGQEALDAIKAQAPDLVLLDLMLPGCSGYEVCQSIRRDPALSGTRILILTAKSGEIERRKGLSLGADAFVTKPFSTSELKLTVRKLLNGDGG